MRPKGSFTGCDVRVSLLKCGMLGIRSPLALSHGEERGKKGMVDPSIALTFLSFFPSYIKRH